MLVEQILAHLSRTACGQHVALVRRDDRPLHQDVPRTRERGWLAHARLFCELGDNRADLLQVRDACVAEGALGAHLEKHLMNEQPSKPSR